MTRFLPTHQSILASSAKVLIIPVSADGVVVSQIVSALMRLYGNEYAILKQRLQKGGLGVGEALPLKVKHQTTGLMPTSSQRAAHVCFMVTHHHHHDTPIISAFIQAWQGLLPYLARLVRYERIQRSGLYLVGTEQVALWQGIQQHVPPLRIDGHFSKDIDLKATYLADAPSKSPLKDK